MVISNVRKLVFFMIGFVFASPNALAGSCDKLLNEDALIACLNGELAAADKELNRTYSKFRESIGDSDRDALKVAETAWIKSRDSDCEFEGGSVSGGSAYQAIYVSCAIGRTKLRTKQLLEWTKIFPKR